MSAAGIKANLKSDPTFRQDLQKRMEGHLGALVADVRKFFEDSVKALKARHGDETEVVLLVDSLEHIRGTYTNARQVQESVETLFAGHADKLKLPNLHVVYTVPPYLKARSMNLGMLYGLGAVQVFPAIKIRDAQAWCTHRAWMRSRMSPRSAETGGACSVTRRSSSGSSSCRTATSATCSDSSAKSSAGRRRCR